MKRALGIEVGRTFAAVCGIAVDGDGPPRRHRFSRQEFPDHEPAPEEVADACLRMAVEAGIRERSAVLVLARSLTYSKAVTLPPLSTEERLRLVSLQPERFFPVSDRALVCDLEPGANGAVPVAHAAEAQRLESLVDALQSRGFRIRAVLPSSAALLRAATRGVPALSGANWILVRPEGTGLTAHAYQARSLRVSRRLESPGADLLAVCREISRTAASCFDTDAPLQEVRWSGWRELPDAARATAAASLSKPVDDLPALPVGSEGLAAYGAALAELEEAPRPDLMPPSVRARRRQQTRWLTGACSGLVVLGAAALIWALGQRQDARLGRLDAAIAQARTAAEAAATAREDVQTLEDRIVAVQGRMQERATWLRLLNEVSNALPAGAWIANLSVDAGGEVTLSGYAATASALIPALDATDALQSVELAAPATRANVGGRELEAFNIRGALKGSSAADPTAVRAPRGMEEGEEIE